MLFCTHFRCVPNPYPFFYMAGAAGKLKEEHKSALDEIDPKWTETTQEIPEPRARRAPPSAGKAAGKKRRGTPKDD